MILSDLRSAAIGASAVLLIVSILTPEELSSFIATSRALGLDALVEVHEGEEMMVALDAGCGDCWD